MYTITKEQLRSITDPKVKEMFPDAFENILQEGKWYNRECGVIAFCENLRNGRSYFNGYCVWTDDSFEQYAELALFGYWQPATNEEVFEALKRAAIKIGYKKDLYCIFGKDKHIRAIDGNQFYRGIYSNSLLIGNECIFKDGQWAEIVNQNLL